MPQFAANLTMLFTEHPFLDRFEQAAKADFKAVEFLFPYAWPAEEIRQRLDAHKFQLVLHNLPAGDWDAGERGIACHPDRVAEFREGVAKAIGYAKVLGVPQLNCLADNPGRNEPGTGEINYAFLFAQLDRIGYGGWIGCEYKPAAGTVAGLGWRERLAQ